MKIDEKAFEAFMLAINEKGPTGLGYRACLEAYEAAKLTHQPDESSEIAKLIHYPECWETLAAYPSLFDALRELAACAGCSECKEKVADKPEDIKQCNCIIGHRVIYSSQYHKMLCHVCMGERV